MIHALGRNLGSSVGLYTATFIRNFSKQPIILMDETNSVVTVDPAVKRAHRDVLQIISWNHNGTRLRYVETTVCEDPIDIEPTETNVDISTLNQGPFFCKELNCMVGLASHRPTMRHPASKSVYDDALVSTMRALGKNSTSATVKYFINDPLGRTPHVFVAVGNQVVRVIVTNSPNAESTSMTCEMVIVDAEGGVERGGAFPLPDDFFDLGKYSGIFDGLPISIGLSIEEARCASNSIILGRSSNIKQEVDRRMDEERKQFSQEKAKLIADHAVEKEKLILKIEKFENVKADLSNRLEKVSSELEVYRSKYENLLKDHELELKRYQNEAEIRREELKVFESETKNARQLMAYETEKFKTDATNLKTFVVVATTILGGIFAVMGLGGSK